jgi:hypothetical protein
MAMTAMMGECAPGAAGALVRRQFASHDAHVGLAILAQAAEEAARRKDGSIV